MRFPSPGAGAVRLLVPHGSLRARLTFGYALIFSACILLGALGVYVTARSSLQRSLDRTLQETASVRAPASRRDRAGCFWLRSSGLPGT